jgi:hypothetical protein
MKYAESSQKSQTRNTIETPNVPMIEENKDPVKLQNSGSDLMIRKNKANSSKAESSAGSGVAKGRKIVKLKSSIIQRQRSNPPPETPNKFSAKVAQVVQAPTLENV